MNMTMAMSAPNPEPRPCTGAGCPINRCFPDPSLGQICYERKKREAEPEPREKREAWGPGDVNCVPDYGYNCEAQYPDYPVFGGCRWECFDYGCLEVC